MSQWWDVQADATATDDYNVGPNSDGTYNIPDTAIQANKPWDTPGSTTGNYGSDVIGLLRDGVAAWSKAQARQDFIDYNRYEATAGGVFRQGNSARTSPVRAQANTQGGMTMLLLVVGAVLLLRKA